MTPAVNAKVGVEQAESQVHLAIHMHSASQSSARVSEQKGDYSIA
jgi:hypothetical protein